MNIKKLIFTLVSWRAITLLIAVVAAFVLPLREGYTQLTSDFKLNHLWLMWANFDGQHYLNIARLGYNHAKTGFLQAFFPLYPIFIKLLGDTIKNYLTSALLISHSAFILAVFFLYKLIRLDHKKNIANLAIYLLLIAPTAFFFGSVYTESIFLLFSVLAFYTARKNNWLLSAVFISLSSATRLTGIFLLPAILIEFFVSHDKNIKKTLKDPHLVWFALAPIGLLSYMRFLYDTVGDPIYFVNVQPFFGAQREVGRFIMLYQVFYRYAKMVVFVDHFSTLFFTVMLELLTGILFLLLSIYAFFKSRLSYAFYLAASYLLPTLTGTFSSLPRYALVLFPAFILMAQVYSQQTKLVRRLFSAVSIILAIVTISLFTRGYFIG